VHLFTSVVMDSAGIDYHVALAANAIIQLCLDRPALQAELLCALAKQTSTLLTAEQVREAAAAATPAPARKQNKKVKRNFPPTSILWAYPKWEEGAGQGEDMNSHTRNALPNARTWSHTSQHFAPFPYDDSSPESSTNNLPLSLFPGKVLTFE